MVYSKPLTQRIVQLDRGLKKKIFFFFTWPVLYNTIRLSLRENCRTVWQNRQIFFLSCRKFQFVWQMSCDSGEKKIVI